VYPSHCGRGFRGSCTLSVKFFLDFLCENSVFVHFCTIMVTTVRGAQGMQKLTKDAVQILNCCTYSSSKFFLLASLADCFYLHFKICSATVVSSMIASD